MVQNSTDQSISGISIRIPVPAHDPKLYGRGAVDDILLYLARNRFDSFTPGELADQLDHAEATVRRAIEVLVGNDLLEHEYEGNRKPVRINRSRLSIPDDPFLRIPQDEFQAPVKRATERLTNELEDVLGIVLYGSVARGEADRRSDIDLWVVVRSDRAPNQRTASNVERDLEEQRFDGDRYEFHIAVEALESIPAFTEDINEILKSGISVHRTDEFDKLRTLLAHGETHE